MKDYLTIKEFSNLSGIEATTLRYWDEIGLFSPMKRDPENNYRYYSPDQMIAINFINVLSGLNIPLKTIDEAAERSPEKIVRLIEQQEKSLDMEMRKLNESYAVIHTRLELVRYGMNVLRGYHAANGLRLESDAKVKDAVFVNKDQIAVLYRDTLSYVQGPRTEFVAGEGFYEPFMQFCGMAEELRVNLSFPIGGLHESMQSFLEGPGAPDYFISIDPSGNRKRKAGYYLVGFTQGYYGEFGDLPDRMMAYVEEHGLELSGPVFSLYLLDEISMKDPSQFLVQTAVAVTKDPARRR